MVLDSFFVLSYFNPCLLYGVGIYKSLKCVKQIFIQFLLIRFELYYYPQILQNR